MGAVVLVEKYAVKPKPPEGLNGIGKTILMDRWGESEVRKVNVLLLNEKLWNALTTARQAEVQRLSRLPIGCRVRKETIDWLDRELQLAKLAARTNKTQADKWADDESGPEAPA